jgi:hypothetical protein
MTSGIYVTLSMDLKREGKKGNNTYNTKCGIENERKRKVFIRTRVEKSRVNIFMHTRFTEHRKTPNSMQSEFFLVVKRMFIVAGER